MDIVSGGVHDKRKFKFIELAEMKDDISNFIAFEADIKIGGH